MYGTHILVGEQTAKKIKSRFLLRKLDTVKVVGKGTPVLIFELMAKKKDCDPKLETLAALFEEGITHYRQRSWPAASDCFQKAIEIRPTDPPSRVYLKRIEAFSKAPPPDGWEGVTVYDYK